MPKLWSETIEAHRTAVREAILETTATLAFEHGPHSVTMSQVAERAGIGRATLYKYFPDVEAILLAWHELQIAGHLSGLVELSKRGGDPEQRLEAVLEAYALIQLEHHGTEIETVLHRGDHVPRAQQQLVSLVADLLKEAAESGGLRRDVPPKELAIYCLHALGAAGSLTSRKAVRRLMAVTVAGLHASQ